MHHVELDRHVPEPEPRRSRRFEVLAIIAALALSLSSLPLPSSAAREPDRDAVWSQLAPYFRPPAEYDNDFGDYPSPLLFEDGTPVKDHDDWQRRRQEILSTWHRLMGPWPPIFHNPEVETLGQQRRENFVQHTVRIRITPNHCTLGYLLIPDGEGQRPAALVVWYNPEGGIGEGSYAFVDYAYQLAKRGFVTLSIGLDGKQQEEVLLPEPLGVPLQPLSGLAYVAANGYHVLAARPEVDPKRVGVLGHSYGGKWSMFAAALYDKFACVAVSDPGIVFDESRSNVNYWHPLYLGYEPGVKIRSANLSEDNPRTGAYKTMIAQGRQLHEIHALIAPRPFFVSGGPEDPPSRWQALNHLVAVNRLLGYENRVGMSHRPEHQGNAESNELIYRFFEYFLKDPKEDRDEEENSDDRT